MVRSEGPGRVTSGEGTSGGVQEYEEEWLATGTRREFLTVERVGIRSLNPRRKKRHDLGPEERPSLVQSEA